MYHHISEETLSHPSRKRQGRVDLLVPIWRFPELVSSHSSREVIKLHDVLEVETGHSFILQDPNPISAGEKGCSMTKDQYPLLLLSAPYSCLPRFSDSTHHWSS